MRHSVVAIAFFILFQAALGLEVHAQNTPAPVSNVLMNAYSRDSSEVIPAIRHMFKRKRSGGVARALVFSALAVGALLAPKPSDTQTSKMYTQPTPTYSGSNSYTTTSNFVDQNVENPTVNYVASGTMALIAITGVIQAAHYSDKKLQMVLQSYRTGNGIPTKYKKLSPKDFEAK